MRILVKLRTQSQVPAAVQVRINLSIGARKLVVELRLLNRKKAHHRTKNANTTKAK
jgi:hypothetical protein